MRYLVGIILIGAAIACFLSGMPPGNFLGALLFGSFGVGCLMDKSTAKQ